MNHIVDLNTTKALLSLKLYSLSQFSLINYDSNLERLRVSYNSQVIQVFTSLIILCALQTYQSFAP